MEHHRNTDDACRSDYRNTEIRLKTTWAVTLNDALQGQANYWIISKPGSEPDLCYTDPKFDVDLFVVGELRAMTSAWMGHSTFEKEIETGAITLTGHELMQRTLTKWLKRSCYASLPSLAEDEASMRVV